MITSNMEEFLANSKLSEQRVYVRILVTDMSISNILTLEMVESPLTENKTQDCKQCQEK